MSRKNLFVLVVLAMLALLCSSCWSDDPCTTCVAKPTASAVEKAVKQVETGVQAASDGLTRSAYGPSAAPDGKKLIESIGAGRSVKELDEFNARCSRFGGTVASKTLVTIGCYK